MADPVWVDGSTPLNSTNMTKLQTRDEKNAPSGYVGLDASSKIVFQGDAVANLYRPSSGVVKTDAVFQVVAHCVGGAGTAREVGIGWSGLPAGAAGVYFGSAADTNLYRLAAGVLKTDSSLYVAGTVQALGGFYYAGHLMTDSMVGAATNGVPAALKMPVYNGGNNLVGYIPIHTG